MIIRYMLKWCSRTLEIARYGDSQPTELMIGMYHSLLLPLVWAEYNFLPRWMMLVIFGIGALQAWVSVMGSLAARQAVNAGVTFLSLMFALGHWVNVGYADVYCLLLVFLAALWCLYRTSFEIRHKLGAK